MVFQNALSFGYCFIMKEFAKEFEGEFNSLRTSNGKKIFLVPIAKEVRRIDKHGEEITKTISYKRKLINSSKFMASSLLSLVDNLPEEIHKIKCKHGHGDDKDNSILYKPLCCNRKYQRNLLKN